MATMVDTLFCWARKTKGSVSDFIVSNFDRNEAAAEANGGLIYKLRHWPDLHASQHTADVLRTLSVMSNRPVNRAWILSSSRLSARRVDELLANLVAQEAVDIVDPGKFRPSEL